MSLLGTIRVSSFMLTSFSSCPTFIPSSPLISHLFLISMAPLRPNDLSIVYLYHKTFLETGVEILNKSSSLLSKNSPFVTPSLYSPLNSPRWPMIRMSSSLIKMIKRDQKFMGLLRVLEPNFHLISCFVMLPLD